VCGCDGSCNPFPAAGSEIFSELQVGDEIELEAGRGYPAANTETTKIIADVNGFSALTADGIRLACQDGMGITKTGNHFDQVDISPAAQQLLDAAKKQLAETEEN